MNQQIVERLERIVSSDNLKIAESMAMHTTFHIGGTADYFVMPENERELKHVIQACREENIPFYVIGNGSNLLVSDSGYRGVIIQIASRFSRIKIETGETQPLLVAEAGVLLAKLANTAAEQALSGLEFASGIPGTLGGAVSMNAGAYGGEIKDHIVKVEVLSPEGEIKILTKKEMKFGYRSSVITEKGYLVLRVWFLLSIGEKEKIKETMADFNRKRREKQPLEYPSAGSAFKRPEGNFAGKLIMEAGLKGYRVGDIMISEKHCGFIINVGKGTAKDVKTLIEDVRKKVLETSGITLEPEVRFLGEF